MKAYSCGTEVVLKLENTKAIISAVEIRFSHIHYEVTYFDGHDRKKNWVQEIEFITNENKKSIGFK